MNLERLRAIYDGLATQHHDSHRRCAWSTAEGQETRFLALTTHINVSGALVLDAGCGDGALSDYLTTHFENVRYVGVDCSAEMINVARKEHPESLFIEDDLLQVQGDYDYVLCCGALNHAMENHEVFVRNAITHMFNLAQVAVSICFLSDNAKERFDWLYYYNPNMVFNIARELTPYVVYNHTYADNDFCITMFRR
ncbi:class I SAM-dependent methyltransferase [bacterium]|nr:class I SAM-dependent methyltransferase [bacterium]